MEVFPMQQSEAKEHLIESQRADEARAIKYLAEGLKGKSVRNGSWIGNRKGMS